MATIELDDTRADQLMFVLANAEGKGITWSIINPLLMEIGRQLQLQRRPQQFATKADGDGREVHDGN